MHADRGIVLPVTPVCLSVCPMSVCAYRNGRIVTLFDILVGESLQFLCPTAVKKINGNSFSGTVNTRDGRNIQYYRLKSPFISETVRDMPMVAKER